MTSLGTTPAAPWGRLAVGAVLALLAVPAQARVVAPEAPTTDGPHAVRVVGEAHRDLAVHIDWTTRTLEVACQARPALPFYASASGTLSTERAARAQGMRALEAALGALALPAEACAQSGPCTVGAVLARDAWARTHVQQALEGATAVRSRYRADGHVALVLALALDGPEGLGAVWSHLGAGIPAASKAEAPVPAVTGAQPYTSVVFDASHLPLSPRLFVRVIDPSGAVLYSAHHVAPAVLAARGQALWAVSTEAAQRDDRIMDRPLVLPVRELVGDAQDLRVDAIGGAQAMQAASLFAQARVAIVVTTPEDALEAAASIEP